MPQNIDNSLKLPDWISLAPDATLPLDFEFTEQSSGPEDLFNINSTSSGCSCDGECSIEICECMQRNPIGNLLDSRGRCIPLLHGIDFEQTLHECSTLCGCAGLCLNSVSSKTPNHKLIIAPAAGKGLGVFAAENIPCGAFICLYAGEYLTATEAKQRLVHYDLNKQVHALLVVREVLPTGGSCLRTQIDATKRGNASRIFNHTCGNGATMEAVTLRRPGSILPAVAMFARRDIKGGEELTFSYGPPNASGDDSQRCGCGSGDCLGFLPREQV